MSDKTGIEWTDASWNPVTGCTKVSEGCRNCYAKSFAERFKGTLGHYFESGFAVTLRPDKLERPLRWTRPRKIFVNSMSDLFHADVPDEYIDRVFAVMALAPQHTFQVLTKRPERMQAYLNNQDREKAISYAALRIHRDSGGLGDIFLPAGLAFGDSPPTFSIVDHPKAWPLPNVWLGVSVENQQAADERIPLLVETPAAVRFLSCEPLLGEVDLSRWIMTPGWTPSYYDPDNIHGHPNAEPTNEHINWVIVGGESGGKARPMHPDAARSLRDQCQAAGVPFLFKQWGEWAPAEAVGGYISEEKTEHVSDGKRTLCVYRFGKAFAGRLLDGRTWDEYPEGRKL